MGVEKGGRINPKTILMLMKLGDLSQSLSTVTFSKFSTFQNLKNIKVKLDSDYHNEST